MTVYTQEEVDKIKKQVQPAQPQKPSTFQRIKQMFEPTPQARYRQAIEQSGSGQEGRMMRAQLYRLQQAQQKRRIMHQARAAMGQEPSEFQQGAQRFSRFAGTAGRGLMRAAYPTVRMPSQRMPSQGGGYAKSPGMPRRGQGKGRPQGTFSGKYVIPGKGPVHVYEWRKWVRLQNRLAAQKRGVVTAKMAQAMAQRGINPQQAQYYAEEVTGQQAMRRPVQQQVQQMPQQMPMDYQQMNQQVNRQVPQQFQRQMQRPVQQFRPQPRVVVERDFFSGKPRIVQKIEKKEAWIQR